MRWVLAEHTIRVGVSTVIPISVWRHAACYEEYVSFCAAVRALGASGVCICVCVFVCVSGCRLFVCFKVQYPSIKLLYNAVFQLCTSIFLARYHTICTYDLLIWYQPLPTNVSLDLARLHADRHKNWAPR